MKDATAALTAPWSRRVAQGVGSLLASLTGGRDGRRYLSNTAWLMAEQILRLLITLLVGIYVARYLGPDSFGLLSYVMACFAIFSVVPVMGTDEVLARDLVRHPERRDAYLATAIWLRLGATALAYLLLLLGLMAGDVEPVTRLYILIVAAGVAFQPFQIVELCFHAEVRSRYPSICRLVQLLLTSLIKLLLVAVGADLFWFVVATVLDQLMAAVGLLLVHHWRMGRVRLTLPDREIARRLLTDGLPLAVSSIVMILVMRLDLVIIGALTDERQLGLYAAASRIAEIWYIVPVMISSSLFPAIVRAKAAHSETYRERLQALCSLLVGMAVVVGIGATLLAEPIVRLLYGAAFDGSAMVLSILVWRGIFVAFGCVRARWMMLEGLSRQMIWLNVAELVLSVTLNFLLIPSFGIVGAGLAYLLSAAISCLALTWAVPRQYKVLGMLGAALIGKGLFWSRSGLAMSGASLDVRAS